MHKFKHRFTIPSSALLDKTMQKNKKEICLITSNCKKMMASLLLAQLFIFLPAAFCHSPEQEAELVNSTPITSSLVLKPNGGKQKTRLAHAEAKFEVKAPREVVWRALTDFPKYPRIFHRIKDCRVLKREGDLVFLESELRPHMLVRRTCNHTVNNLGGRPNVLDWKLLDGCFKNVTGKWELLPAKSGNSCQVTYILEVDPGPVIPPFVLSFALGMVQKEVVSGLKDWVENNMPQEGASGAHGTPANQS